jgi:hypothetical protein
VNYMPFTGVTLTDLNNFMKNYPTGKIVPGEYFDFSLYDALKNNIKTDGFYGDLAEQLIQTSFPFTGQAFAEDADIPLPDDLGFVKMFIPLREIIANAGLTHQALKRATGGNSSWGPIVARTLDAQMVDFKYVRELAAIGDGTGRLARVSASVYAAGPPKTLTVTCDNTYADFGWENVALMKVGMSVEIYKSDGTAVADDAGATSWRVTAVTFGNRNNGAATTGTFVISPSSDISANVDDGAVVHLKGTRSLSVNDSAGSGSGTTTCYAATLGAALKCALPMGLVGIVQNASTNNYTDGAINTTLTTFQGLTRANYPTLNAAVYGAGDFGGVDNTPADWDLSVISDAMNQNYRNTGKWVDLLMCSSELAMAISRRNRAEAPISVTVNTTKATNQNVVGSMYANTFLRPDGTPIPIKVSNTIPRNVLYGLCTDTMAWYVKGDYDYLRLTGEIWMKSPDDRKANFEAPYGGMDQVGVERCDTHFCIFDMKDNI